MNPEVRLPTNHGKLDADLIALLKGLAAGDAIKISYLATGVTVDRVAADDIVVPTVHFTKANGELASVALDENTKIARV